MLCILRADGCLCDTIYGWAAHYIQKLNFHIRQTEFIFFYFTCYILFMKDFVIGIPYIQFSAGEWKQKIEGESRKRAKATE